MTFTQLQQTESLISKANKRYNKQLSKLNNKLQKEYSKIISTRPELSFDCYNDITRIGHPRYKGILEGYKPIPDDFIILEFWKFMEDKMVAFGYKSDGTSDERGSSLISKSCHMDEYGYIFTVYKGELKTFMLNFTIYKYGCKVFKTVHIEKKFIKTLPEFKRALLSCYKEIPAVKNRINRIKKVLKINKQCILS